MIDNILHLEIVIDLVNANFVIFKKGKIGRKKSNYLQTIWRSIVK